MRTSYGITETCVPDSDPGFTSLLVVPIYTLYIVILKDNSYMYHIVILDIYRIDMIWSKTMRPDHIFTVEDRSKAPAAKQ